MAIEWENSKLSINTQCELLGLSKSSLYYGRPASETQNNLNLMDLIDRQNMETPFYGTRRMTIYLNSLGYNVNRKRVGRLMRIMGMEGISPKRNISKRNHAHKIYPYLLKGLKIDHPHHVWSSDITYLRIRGGYVYLVGVIDWFSRYILSWKLSNSLDSDFCIEALEDALNSFDKPEIFNTDQGSQYTSSDFTSKLLNRGIKISMDGRGRALDNVIIERFWRTLKYEEVYIKNYAEKSMTEVYKGLVKYINFYNMERFHASLRQDTPWVVLTSGPNQ